MNRSRRLRLVLAAAAVLLAAGSVLAWRSTAAPATEALPPAGLAGQGNAAPAAPAAAVPGGPGFQMVSAFQFKPRWSGNTWDYQELDLYNPGTGTSYFDASFTLPNHVVVTRLVIYYYDNNGTHDLTAWLYRGDVATGDFSFMAEVSSSGAVAQYRNASDTTIDLATVDQQTYSYIITIAIPAAGNSLRLTGVRVDYAYGVSLPLVLRND
jgi:hypothetical protein